MIYCYVLQNFSNVTMDLLAIQEKSLDRALLLYIFIREVRSSGVRASITIVHIRKFYKTQQCIVRLRFFFRIAKRSIVITLTPHDRISCIKMHDNNAVSRLFCRISQPRSQAPNGLLAISTVDRFGPWYGFPIRGNICNHHGFLIYAAGCDYHGDKHFPN